MPGAQLAPQRAFEVVRLAAATPDFFAGELACQSETSWRYERSACWASSRSRRRTSLRLYAAEVPLQFSPSRLWTASRMNSEPRSVPGTTTPPMPITWSLMTFSHVAPRRRPK